MLAEEGVHFDDSNRVKVSKIYRFSEEDDSKQDENQPTLKKPKKQRDT